MATEGKGNPEKINQYISEVTEISDDMLNTLNEIEQLYTKLSEQQYDLKQTVAKNTPINTITIGKYFDKTDEQLALINFDTIRSQRSNIIHVQESVKEIERYFKTQYLDTMRDNGETLDWF